MGGCAFGRASAHAFAYGMHFLSLSLSFSRRFCIKLRDEWRALAVCAVTITPSYPCLRERKQLAATCRTSIKKGREKKKERERERGGGRGRERERERERGRKECGRERGEEEARSPIMKRSFSVPAFNNKETHCASTASAPVPSPSIPAPCPAAHAPRVFS